MEIPYSSACNYEIGNLSYLTIIDYGEILRVIHRRPSGIVMHYDRIEAGFVDESYYWKYSSVIDYSGGKGLVQVSYL